MYTECGLLRYCNYQPSSMKCIELIQSDLNWCGLKVVLSDFSSEDGVCKKVKAVFHQAFSLLCLGKLSPSEIYM